MKRKRQCNSPHCGCKTLQTATWDDSGKPVWECGNCGAIIARRVKNIWSGLEDAESDLCLKRPEGYYDVTNGVDGWVVLTPTERWVHNESSWVSTPQDATPLRGVAGVVSRDEAQRLAENLIKMRAHA